MWNFVAGAAAGSLATWAVMKYVLGPTILRDKVTGEITHIIMGTKTFVDATVQRLGL